MTTLNRRAVLAGACGTCAAALASCAAYGPAQPATAPAPTAQGGQGGSANGGGTTGGGLASTADVPVGGGVVLESASTVITQPQAGTFKAFSSVCTHQGCQVGSVENGTINCPCHGSQFAIADGSVITGPAKEPLAAKKIKVSGTSITAA